VFFQPNVPVYRLAEGGVVGPRSVTHTAVGTRPEVATWRRTVVESEPHAFCASHTVIFTVNGPGLTYRLVRSNAPADVTVLVAVLPLPQSTVNFHGPGSPVSVKLPRTVAVSPKNPTLRAPTPQSARTTGATLLFATV